MNAAADAKVELRRIRETPCPSCGSLRHFVVDPDDPRGPGEYLRYCDGCGTNFVVGEGEAAGAARRVRVDVSAGFYFHPDDEEVRP